MAKSLKDKAIAESRLRSTNRELLADNKRQRKIIEDLGEQLEKERKARFVLPTGVRKTRKSKSFCRVIVADTHGCFVNNEALQAFLKDLELIDPEEIVFLGDHLDCAGWLARHHPFKTIQEAKYSFEEDLAAANFFLDRVCEISPRSRKHYMEGNHEDRLEAFCVEQSAGNTRDAAYLRRSFGPEVILGLKERKIPYYRRTEKHSGLRVRGVLQLGNCYFCHGISHASNAAKVHLDKLKRNVVFGHVHRAVQWPSADVKNQFGAWCPGCLCELEPMWKHSQPTEWTHGYGLQTVTADDMFLHINIPIIDGRSLLGPLAKGVLS